MKTSNFTYTPSLLITLAFLAAFCVGCAAYVNTMEGISGVVRLPGLPL
jgi:hypothetical protein